MSEILWNGDLEKAVNDYARSMKIRLHEKEEQGYEGWDNPNTIDSLSLISSIRSDLNEMQHAHDDKFLKLCIDIGNRAMMLWYRVKQEASRS
jgi:hypothetical protein